MRYSNTRRLMAIRIALLSIGFELALTTHARGQTKQLPEGTVARPAADAWRREILTEGFLSARRRIREEEKKTHATQLSVSLGAMLSGGNARFFGASIDQRFRRRRDNDQFSERVAANYATAAQPGQAQETTVENVQTHMRYDRFFLNDWIAFFGIQMRHDRFQGLDLRLQMDPGIGFYLINASDERLWVESGYELLLDIRASEALFVRGPSGEMIFDERGVPVRLPRSRTLHGGRLLAGYSAEFNDSLSFSADVEYIQAIDSAKLFRINAGATMTTRIKTDWSLAATFGVRYENQPLPEKRQLDTVSTLNVVYNFL